MLACSVRFSQGCEDTSCCGDPLLPQLTSPCQRREGHLELVLLIRRTLDEIVTFLLFRALCHVTLGVVDNGDALLRVRESVQEHRVAT